jgi:hypothetical protein
VIVIVIVVVVVDLDGDGDMDATFDATVALSRRTRRPLVGNRQREPVQDRPW